MIKMTINQAEIELLLAKVLGVDQTYLISHPSPRLSPRQRWRYARLLRRRRQGWPIAYLTGEKWFYGRPFAVNRHVLIPRPETELLIEKVKETNRINKKCLIIDVGTGNGIIAITLTKEIPKAKIIATDISKKALTLAKLNARRLKAANRIKFYQGNLLEAVPKKYLNQPIIIIANLPYLPTSHKIKDTPFEPRLALYGKDQSGLKLITKLIEQSLKYPNLKQLWLEFDPRQSSAVRELLREKMPRGSVSIYKDLSGRPRAAVWYRCQ